MRVTHLEPKAWLYDTDSNRSWKDHLTTILTARLKGAANRGVDPSVIAESEYFLSHLEKFTPKKKLYSFTATSKHLYAGVRIIDDLIVFCMTHSKEN